MKVRSRLAEIINERGMKQVFISEKSGISRNAVSELVKGYTPSLPSALKIAKVLGLTVEDIWMLEE